jgi:predicted Zn finger-like uncharacterized protein
MTIRTRCPSCQSVYNLADQLAGKTVRCKKCEAAIVVRAAKGDVEEEAVETKSRRESGSVQTRANSSKSSPARTEDEPIRPRRRNREDDDDLDVRHSRRRSNRGLVIGLIAGGVGLLLLLAGGVALAILLFRSGKSLVNADSSWPTLNAPLGAPDSVVLHISGVVDDNTQEAVSDRLQAIAQGGGNSNMASTRQGDRMTVWLTPVHDVEALSRMIDFGTVESVDGNTITVSARKAEGPPANADVVTKALHQLKSPVAHRRLEAVRKLKEMLPDEKHRAEVVKALEPLMNDKDHFTRQFAIEAIGVWGNKDAVPLLLNAMREKETRTVAMNALGRIKDERAAEPIADRLEDFFDRHEAAEALKRMGPIAEKAVLAHLNHHEWMVQQVVCDILAAIGTKQSIPALEKVVAAGKDPFSGEKHLAANFAQQAIRAIKARQ